MEDFKDFPGKDPEFEDCMNIQKGRDRRLERGCPFIHTPHCFRMPLSNELRAQLKEAIESSDRHARERLALKIELESGIY